MKSISLFFVLVFAFSAGASASVATPSDPVPDGDVTHALVLSSESLTVSVGGKIQMTATVTNVASQPEIVWSSSDSSIAVVDKNGAVWGVSKGDVKITATAVVEGETLRGEYDITVTAMKKLLKNLLEKQQILSYQYSYIDDYYYTNDKEAWQYHFGFGRLYDIASPYLLLEYDYIRVFFTYENKDWMLQMWKGQYGLVFYGGEIGIYNREHSEDGVSDWAFYNCPGEEDWLNMELTLWHEELNGTWTREFTREYDKYWWCTGFKNGHLRQEEPADELRMTGRITFKDEEMAKIVADGLKECGFKMSGSKDNIGLDQIFVDGKDISFCWQNISEAENTMAIKVISGYFAAIAAMPFWPLIFPYAAAFGLLTLLVSIIL